MSKIKDKPLDVTTLTRLSFPVGQTVRLEGIMDTACGWEFDAPLHIMRPWHQYHIISSICTETIEGIIEDLIVDLCCGRTVKTDADSWPYGEDYLRNLFRRARRGVARGGAWYFTADVTMRDWNLDEAPDYSCIVKLFYQGKLETD